MELAQAPKGLMGLGDILDEYISLKEQRLMVDQEKRRLEMALRGIQDVMRVYYSAGAVSTSLPSSPPLLPNVMAISTGPFFPAPNYSAGSPSGTCMLEFICLISQATVYKVFCFHFSFGVIELFADLPP